MTNKIKYEKRRPPKSYLGTKPEAFLWGPDINVVKIYKDLLKNEESI